MLFTLNSEEAKILDDFGGYKKIFSKEYLDSV